MEYRFAVFSPLNSQAFGRWFDPTRCQFFLLTDFHPHPNLRYPTHRSFIQNLGDKLNT